MAAAAGGVGGVRGSSRGWSYGTVIMCASVWVAVVFASCAADAVQADSLKRVKRVWQAPTPQAKENAPKPYPIYVTTYVSDKLQFYPLTYRLEGPGASQDPRGLFTIDNDGKVWVTSVLDREKQSRYAMTVHAMDRSMTDVEEPANLVVDVEDENDCPPIFVLSSLSGTVDEMSPAGTFVMRLNATDADDPNTLNAMVVYSIESQPPGNPFLVNAQTGVVTTQLANLDRELQETVTFVVKARDLQGAPLCLSATATATVRLNDINDNWPVFDATMVVGKVMENKRDVTVAGLSVKDRDQSGSPNWRAVYRIVAGDEHAQFAVRSVPDTNGGAVTVVKPLDFEVKERYTLVIAVANEVPFVGPSSETERTATVEISVTNEDEPPAFTPNPKEIYIEEQNAPGKQLDKLVARDPDLAQQGLPLRYQIASDPAHWVSVEPATGVLTATASMDRESPFVKNGTYTVTVLAIQDGSPPSTGTSTVNIYLKDLNDNVPVVSVPGSAHACLPEDASSPTAPVVLRATDADAVPNGAPFTFELLNDPAGTVDRWDLRKNGTDSAVLALKTAMLSPGYYNLSVLVRDQQGLGEPRRVPIRVCRCGGLLQGSACSGDSVGGIGLGWDALAAILFSVFAMLLFGLLCCLFCRSQKPRLLHLDDFGGMNAGLSSLVKYNEEGGKEHDKVVPMFTEADVEATTPGVHKGRLELMDDGSVNGDSGHTNSGRWSNNGWAETTETITTTKVKQHARM
ncbi:cadherin-2-like [Lampetra fluviatilis]